MVKEKDSQTTPRAAESRYSEMNLWTVPKFFSQVETIDHAYTFFYKQNFYKQNQANTGKKSSKS